MNLIVTGSRGCIGEEFVVHANAAGHQVTRFFRDQKFPWWKGYDAVIHLAAAGVRRTSPTRTWDDCIAGNFGLTVRILQSITLEGATPTVFISGSIREKETKERPDYWSDPYIVSQKLRRLFVEEWAKTYRGRVIHPFCERCGDLADVEKLCAQILRDIHS